MLTEWTELATDVKFVGLQAWQSQTAIHSLQLISLNTTCLANIESKGHDSDGAGEVHSNGDLLPQTAEPSSSKLQLNIIILIALVSLATLTGLLSLVFCLYRRR